MKAKKFFDSFVLKRKASNDEKEKLLEFLNRRLPFLLLAELVSPSLLCLCVWMKENTTENFESENKASHFLY